MSELNLAYRAASSSEVLPLCHGDKVHIDTTPLHAWEFSYELGYRGITGVSRPSREVTVSAAFDSKGAADLARRVFSLDVDMRTPGTLEFDGWSTRAYVTSCAVEDQTEPITAKLSVVLFDGIWRKGVTQSFNPIDLAGSDYLDLPYDLPYDLAPTGAASEVEGPEWAASPVRLVIYGYVANPSLTIGGNLYAIDCTVPAGGYLVVDGLERAVYEVTADGTTTNRIADARRGDGEGSGEYIFEKIKPGTQYLSWPHSFGFDLTYYLEEGEPPWTL